MVRWASILFTAYEWQLKLTQSPFIWTYVLVFLIIPFNIIENKTFYPLQNFNRRKYLDMT